MSVLLSGWCKNRRFLDIGAGALNIDRKFKGLFGRQKCECIQGILKG
jgi:hypothetical protein